MNVKPELLKEAQSPIGRLIRFCLDNKIVTGLFVAGLIAWGIMVAPFEWDIKGLIRNPVPVDAIPDIGENQQIVFTRWMGRSPQDIEDQITYPLTVALMGVPGIKTVRSFSMFGFSSIYVIFEEKVEFYWSRSRILEKLSSLPPGTIPDGVQPIMGPDATALGQVFWYTLEGRDENGNPAGGWDLQELRTIQDYYVKYGLMAAGGVAEVASCGGFVKEYQVDADPDAMRYYGVTLDMVLMAVKNSNLDIAARTIEINKVEYVIRGIGFVKKISDLEKAVVKINNNVPITVGDIAKISYGPAIRRGMFDKEGTEAVGGVVVTRYGENPLEVIQNIKKKIIEISPGLQKKTLSDGTVSQVTIIPFYDRSGLILETLGTLNEAIYLEILITILVILVMINNLGSSLIISAVLPLAVLVSFIGMKMFGVDANIVSLSGIAIAIGTIVDMGIILSENVLKHLERAGPEEDKKDVIFGAALEVGSAIVTAVITTIISFLPVFTMEAAEGKLFKPLAFTKTFALLGSIIVALTVLPPVFHLLFGGKGKKKVSLLTNLMKIAFICFGIFCLIFVKWWVGLVIIVIGVRTLIDHFLSPVWKKRIPIIANTLVIGIVGLLLTLEWVPVGADKSLFVNLLFVVLCVGGLLWFFKSFVGFYPEILSFFLDRKWAFLVPIASLILLGAIIWLGFSKIFFFLPDSIRKIKPVAAITHAFPGLGKEFMPPLDEGAYLYMPTTMVHASIGEVQEVLRIQDMAIKTIPEVTDVVGKLGRIESPLDPAPISMIETIINYKPEFITDEKGHRKRFKYDKKSKRFFRDNQGNLVPDKMGKPFRQWRDTIKKADDIWDEVVEKAKLIGVTSAPKLQPISTRLVMLQSGMRAPMGIKVHGPSLDVIEKFGFQLEKLLKEVPVIEPAAVFADRIVGKPYLEIHIDREAIARYGLSIQNVQNIISIAIGGMAVTSTVEGRERYKIRVRYPREQRGLGSGIDDLKKIIIPVNSGMKMGSGSTISSGMSMGSGEKMGSGMNAGSANMGSGMNPGSPKSGIETSPGRKKVSTGMQIPLGQLATIEFRQGPQMIKSEDTFLTGYVLFDKKPGSAEVDVVDAARKHLQHKIDIGELVIPAGVSYRFAGSYESQERFTKRLRLILPLTLFLIFLVLYFQFKNVTITFLVFGGIIVAWSGGFLLIWLYAQDWFLNVNFLGANLRNIFQIHPINLSVAIWVGFLALFGIASDDGVVIITYLNQQFSAKVPETISELRKMAVEGATRRVRPAMMTSATTILALLPVLSSTGRGADVMVPMAIPSFGGMMIELLTIFLAPILYCMIKENKFKRESRLEEKI